MTCGSSKPAQKTGGPKKQLERGCLHFAAAGGDTELAELLLRHEASPREYTTAPAKQQGRCSGTVLIGVMGALRFLEKQKLFYAITAQPRIGQHRTASNI